MTEQIPSFHDGYVTGIRLWESTAAIYIRRADGGEYELSLTGLEALQIDDFREGNIISSVEIVAGRSPDSNTEFDRLFPPPHPSAAAQYQDAHAAFVRRQIARIESAEISLVMIVPSYGADLLALCRSTTCRQS